jgi:hypothetical protein
MPPPITNAKAINNNKFIFGFVKILYNSTSNTSKGNPCKNNRFTIGGKCCPKPNIAPVFSTFVRIKCSSITKINSLGSTLVRVNSFETWSQPTVVKTIIKIQNLEKFLAPFINVIVSTALHH